MLITTSVFKKIDKVINDLSFNAQLIKQKQERRKTKMIKVVLVDYEIHI